MPGEMGSEILNSSSQMMQKDEAKWNMYET